jgi:hypothetical protein
MVAPPPDPSGSTPATYVTRTIISIHASHEATGEWRVLMQGEGVFYSAVDSLEAYVRELQMQLEERAGMLQPCHYKGCTSLVRNAHCVSMYVHEFRSFQSLGVFVVVKPKLSRCRLRQGVRRYCFHPFIQCLSTAGIQKQREAERKEKASPQNKPRYQNHRRLSFLHRSGTPTRSPISKPSVVIKKGKKQNIISTARP